MSFKLLAIRPLNDCHQKFLKNLIPNQIYSLYNDYEITTDDEEDIISVKHNDILHRNLYYRGRKKDKTKINISAIVGKNGSGKSALVELFIMCLNQLSMKLQIEDKIIGEKIEKKLLTTATLQSARKDKDFKCQLLFEINEKYFSLKINNDNYEYKEIGNSKEIDFNLKDFFYTIIINYSIYGFNSNVMGDWINELFHKNDSYQIPIVINPKREGKDNRFWAGIIDINNEEFLLKQRLLGNLLKPSKINDEFRIIGDNMIAVALELNKKEIRDFYIYSNDEYQVVRKYSEYNDKKDLYDQLITNDSSDFSINIDAYNQEAPLLSCHNVSEILNEIKISFDLKDIQNKDLQVQLDYYIIYKIISICDKYIEYNQFVNESYKIFEDREYKRYTINIKDFIKHIFIYRSHITYKLFQTINYIKHYEDVWKNVEIDIQLDLETLSKKLEPLLETTDDFIEVLPPPIFETEIFLNNKKNDDLIKLSELSSGEQQFIHSVSSIVYHLNNINSVKGEGIAKYTFINLIFDEIELYFHPEFQRKFVNYILNQISKIQINDIVGINILFITHSPFILSDIPKQNVLFLEVDEETKESKPQNFKRMNTFGANITDLLADSFFINNGLIGDFAKQKIEETITWLNSILKLRENIKKMELTNNDQINNHKIINIKKKINNLLKQETNLKNENFKRHLKLIEIIDEPILKEKLEEMYAEATFEFPRKEILKNQIVQMQKQLEELQNQHDNA